MQLNALLSVCDLWTHLKNSSKPIVLYGMGDGADKIIDVCENFGIEISGVFASDGFASGKLFHGFPVITYSQMCEKYNDFIVLLSFASSRSEVLDNVYRIAKEKELYCPDVPVFGDGLFDFSFFKANFEKFRTVYDLLCDEQSKKTYCNVITAKLTGNIQYLRDCETTVDEAYLNLIKPNKLFSYADIGAYNGDTIREFLSFSGGASKIYAFEPDVKNYKKLFDYAESAGLDTSKIFNVAAYSHSETLTFYSRSGRNSASTTSHKNAKSIEVQAEACDRLIDGRVDFINIDAEGSDMKVLQGLKNTISLYRPTISCAVYHRNEDTFALPLQLYELYGGCELYIRHFPYLPAWDTNVYAKPIKN